MMALVNDFYKANSITKGEYATLILLLNPVAPHMTEELWEMHFGQGRAYQQRWPEYDEAKTVESTVEIAVQINGKVKATLMVGLDEDEASVKEKAHAIPVIGELTTGKNIVKATGDLCEGQDPEYCGKIMHRPGADTVPGNGRRQNGQ